MSTRLIENRKNGANIKRCTNMERMFVFHMLASESRCSTEGAREAGYKNPSQAANKLLKRPHIKALLGAAQREREERTQLSADDVWRYLHRVMFFDPAEIFSSAGDGWWWLKDLNDIPLEVRQMIEEVDIGVMKINGEDVPRPKIKLVSKSTAVTLAAKHTIPERHEHDHSHRAAIPWDDAWSSNGEPPDAIEQQLEE